jgi:hypothetical protein
MATNFYEVSEEQLQACTRHIGTDGKPYYTVTSATDPDGFYTVRWNEFYAVPQDNCKSGRAGEPCWHKRAALASEAIEQDAARHEQRERTQERNATVQRADGSWW